MSLCESTDKLYFLGSGMPLFFDYSWFVFWTLLIAYVVYGIYATINFVQGDYCDEMELKEPGYCGDRWKTQISAGNTAFFDLNGYEKLCACLLFVVLFIMRVIFFRAARKKDTDIDSDHTTPSDYTVKISGLPKSIKPQEVIDIISRYNYGDGKKVEVEKINFAYYIGDFIEAANKFRVIRVNLASEMQKPEEEQDKKLIESLTHDKAKIK